VQFFRLVTLYTNCTIWQCARPGFARARASDGKGCAPAVPRGRSGPNLIELT